MNSKKFTEARTDKMRAARKKWLLPLAEMALWQAVNWIDNAGTRQLRATLRAMESCTQTNCWWAEMEATLLFRARVEARLNNPATAGGG